MAETIPGGLYINGAGVCVDCEGKTLADYYVGKDGKPTLKPDAPDSPVEALVAPTVAPVIPPVEVFQPAYIKPTETPEAPEPEAETTVADVSAIEDTPEAPAEKPKGRGRPRGSKAKTGK